MHQLTPRFSHHVSFVNKAYGQSQNEDVGNDLKKTVQELRRAKTNSLERKKSIIQQVKGESWKRVSQEDKIKNKEEVQSIIQEVNDDGIIGWILSKKQLRKINQQTRKGNKEYSARILETIESQGSVQELKKKSCLFSNQIFSSLTPVLKNSKHFSSKIHWNNSSFSSIQIAEQAIQRKLVGFETPLLQETSDFSNADSANTQQPKVKSSRPSSKSELLPYVPASVKSNQINSVDVLKSPTTTLNETSKYLLQSKTSADQNNSSHKQHRDKEKNLSLDLFKVASQQSTHYNSMSNRNSWNEKPGSTGRNSFIRSRQNLLSNDERMLEKFVKQNASQRSVCSPKDLQTFERMRKTQPWKQPNQIQIFPNKDFVARKEARALKLSTTMIKLDKELQREKKLYNEDAIPVIGPSLLTRNRNLQQSNLFEFWSNEPYRKTFLLYDCLEDPSKLDQKEEEEQEHFLI